MYVSACTILVCSGKIDSVPLFSGILMIEIGNIKEVRSNIFSHTKCIVFD